MYAKYLKIQDKARKGNGRHHGEYFDFKPLQYALYNGKSFNGKVNEGIRRKIFKQIITASNEGMFNFASNYKTDMTSLWGLKGYVLTNEDYLDLLEFGHTVNPHHGKSISKLQASLLFALVCAKRLPWTNPYPTTRA